MKAFYAGVLRVEARVAAALLVLMVVLIFLGSVARVAGSPLNWTTDAATCFFAWACFLCADVAWRRGAMMSIDLAVARLPAPLRKLLRLANYLIIGVFLAYVVVMGLWLTWISRARSFQGIPEVSYSWVTLSMPVGAALLLITTLLKVRDELAAPAGT